MNFLLHLVAFLTGYEISAWRASIAERETMYDLARFAARGKPLLVVGRPKGRHPVGDVCIDLFPNRECVYGDVERLSAYPEKYFGAAFISHVLEHVENPVRAFAELHRVADRVYVAYPDRLTLIAWFHPTHRWILLDVPQGTYGPLKFMRNPVQTLYEPRLRLPPPTR